jgi:hypothetical protein
MYPDNSWYSHRIVLSRYCNINPDRHIFGGVLHGFVPLYSRLKRKYKIIVGKRKFSIAPFFFWNRRQLQQAQKKGLKNVYAIGAQFLYLCKLKKKNLEKKCGTLVMPLKTSPDFKSIFADDKLLNFVEKRFLKPYIICVGADDYKLFSKKIKKRKKEWKVVTCGERTDPRFLFRLYKFISNTDSVIATFAGSVVLYSMFMKKKTYVIDYYKQNNKKVLFHPNYYPEHLEALKDFKKFGINIKNLNDKNNYKGVLEILGYNCLKTPRELKILLGWDSIIKLFFSKLFAIIYDLIKGKDLRKFGSYKNWKYES